MVVNPSISDIEEASLVEQLLADRHLRSNLLGIRDIPPDALYFQKVDLDGIPGGVVGDVDILLCTTGRPDLAVAIEAKRVKIRNHRLNKLHGFKKGVRQANLLARIGFSQVYLFVLVVADSREQNAGRVSYDGPNSYLGTLVERAISASKLNPRVGLMHYEFVQPMDHAPLGVGALGAYGARLVQSAQAVPQSVDLTRWVAGVMNHGTK